MSVTYTAVDHADHDRTESAVYVPVYARKRAARGRSGKGGLKTWMILAPLGVLTIGGIATAMVVNGREPETVPTQAAPPQPSAQTDLAALAASPGTDGALGGLRVAEPIGAAPVAVAPPTPVRRAPVTRRATQTPATAPAPVETVDSGDDVTAELNRAQAGRTSPPTSAAPVAPTPRTPDITVSPLGL
jgi:hypothetical protein